MPRDISAAVIAELTARTCESVKFFEAECDSKILYLWTGDGDFSWDGKTWLGNGWLQEISSIDENSNIVASGISVVLSGIPQELVFLALDEMHRKHRGYVWKGFLDEDGALVDDPYLLFPGYFDGAEHRGSGDSAILTLKYEHKLIKLRKPREHRYTDENQKALFPLDRGFEYMTTLEQWTGHWGPKED